MPFEPVAALGVAAVLSRETGEGSLLGYLYVFVMGLTLLPWLLGYGITRVTRAVRTPQARHVIRLVRVTAGLMTRDRGCQS
ncbi:hypothetical protein [Streptomyces sp. NPDC096132]|uniref:hypothetical protein n=1 Tax=Streptomyces sp. NPDC096132 TaxID=3366075 RepID=UPI0037F7EB93